MNNKFPDSLVSYYHNNKTDFEARSNKSKKIIYFIILAGCVFLMFMPGVIPVSSLIVRIIAGIGILISGLSALYGGVEYYNKKSGGIIKNGAIKKFDSGAISEQEIAEMFAKNDYKGLANAISADNQPIQLFVDEDEVGKVFYLLLKKYYSQSDFSGMSEVKVISEPEYSEVYKYIKNIKST